MSTDGAAAYRPLLRRLGEQLAIPLPTRTRILRELAGDLDGLTARFAADGLPMEEAQRRALELLVPDTDALAQLSRLHSPIYRRLTAGITPARLVVWERTAFVLSGLVLLLAEGWLLLSTDLAGYASPFLWPVLAMGAAVAVGVAKKGFDLWVKGDHTRPRRGLDPILMLSGVTLVVGVCGVTLDIYSLAAAAEQAPHLAGVLARHWIVRDAGLLTVALLIAMAGGLAWFVFTHWVTATEVAHHEVVGAPTTPIPTKEARHG